MEKTISNGLRYFEVPKTRVLMVVFEVLAHLDKRVRSLIGNLDKPAGTCSLAYSGAFPTSIGLNVSSETFSNSWVMDSGATDHMTNLLNGFFTYLPCPSSRKIATTDGSLTTIVGVGDVKLGPSLILKNVLHVPRLFTNLVSIKKLTQDLRCNVVFHHSYCVFQDEDSRRMIGHARERDGLYYLETLSQSSITKGKLSYSFVSGIFHLIKRKFGFTIADLDIHHLESLKFCFLLYLKV